jgi:DNA-binding beta-propeller fold protein YncE
MSLGKNRAVRSWISAINFYDSKSVTAVLLGVVLLTSVGAHGQTSAGNALAAEQSRTAVRAFPRVDFGDGRQLEYVGTFASDGKFKPLTKFGLFIDSMKTASVSGQPISPVAQPLPAKTSEDDLSKQVPPSIELHRNERLVEDFQPPERAVKVAKGNSMVVELRDSIVSLVYGPEKVLVAPQSVTTDSRMRVIVTDAAAHGLHVFAYDPKDSFQIVGGPGRRLQSPYGIAVDSDDNIYVSDSERGTILVYDSEGRFVRTIGSFGDEGLFERPTGIAIDRKAGHLYILDPPRHVLFILDLDGKVLARVGTVDGTGSGFNSRAGSTEPGRFKNPNAVIVHNDELIVLDERRIHILDLQGKFLKEFKISKNDDQPANPAPGLFVDADNLIYVSDPGSGNVRVYNHDGQLLRTFGRPGIRLGEFNGPAGMWADSTGRIYIVDANNRRVQIFRFSGPN